MVNARWLKVNRSRRRASCMERGEVPRSGDEPREKDSYTPDR